MGRGPQDAHQAVGAGQGQQAVLAEPPARQRQTILPQPVKARQLGCHQGIIVIMIIVFIIIIIINL